MRLLMDGAGSTKNHQSSHVNRRISGALHAIVLNNGPPSFKLKDGLRRPCRLQLRRRFAKH